MVTNRQVRKLMKLLRKGKTLKQAADEAGMCDKTARKYWQAGRWPSELHTPHTWRTRSDPFEKVWPEVFDYLEHNEGLQAKTLFEWLQREYPGQFQDGQLRTLQRGIKRWRATKGPAKEVMFPQTHEPGRLAESDFTHLGQLGITIEGVPFDHLIYHFVLTYSNWETGTICFSESFESLAEGLQNALHQLGGVPRLHQTDSLTAAVKKIGSEEEFTDRYRALLSHYRMEGQHTTPQRPNENGDVEQRHYRFKEALDQRLMLRGSRDFESREAYAAFLRTLFAELNAGRQERFKEELAALRELPLRRLESYQRLKTKVGPSSTIRVKKNVYSVHSRLIGEQIQANVHAEKIEVFYGSQRVERLPRLRGEGKHRINYRHIIDWLVRKPGAFERYRYRDALYPTSRFRVAYDALKAADPLRGHKTYLKILHLAATENELAVDECLRWMIDEQVQISAEAIELLIKTEPAFSRPREVEIDQVELAEYDQLCDGFSASTEEWEGRHVLET